MAPLTRRAVLAGAAALAAAAALPRLRLRLLETSDLHMFVYDYDYYHDRPDPTVGLAKVASLIRAARAEHPNTMLFDNGDIIQGNPLGDYLATPGKLAPGAIHPMFQAMNLLGYDAATLGNHEFNYGLPFLEHALAGANFPFVCANLDHVDGRSYVPPTMVFTRDVTLEDGSVHKGLRIGVIGFVPPQIMTWDRSNLEGRVRTTDIVDAAQRHIPALRAQCDVLVALCHSGIDSGPVTTGMENASYHLASVPGIDVIFTGHSHRVFPGPDYAGRAGIDAVRGTLAGVPAVMPGFWGSHLGVIDLTLVQQDGAWKVTDFAVAARPIYRREGPQLVSLAQDDPAILDAVKPAHTATIDWVHQPVGRLAFPVNSYFALLQSESSVGLVNAAQLWYARQALAGTGFANLPLLSAAAPFKAGGTGPDSFIDIPAGPVALRDIADLYMFANTLVVVRVTGAQIQDWLERACGQFQQIDPTRSAPQELLNRSFPTYNFDVISGLTYAIDLSQPSRFDGRGGLANPSAHRVIDLSWNGQPIDPAQSFAVVTNNYRSDGGGRFAGLDGTQAILRAPDLNREAVVRFIQSSGTVASLPPPVWRFARPAQPVALTFRSAPALAADLAGHDEITPLDEMAQGYRSYLLRLG